MKENFAALIKVKTIVTFALVAIFGYLAITGHIKPENVTTIVTTVIAFYFGSQVGKDK